MPENTADFDIPKPLDADKPPSIEEAAGPGFDRIDELFGAIDLSQLVVPGSNDGKFIIVKDGAAAYKAMSGDGTIDEDGVFQLGAKVVGTSELGDKAVTTGKVDDKAITTAKVGDGAIETAKIKDGAATDAKFARPALRGRISATGATNQGTGFTSEKTGTGIYVIKANVELPTTGIPVGNWVDNEPPGVVTCATFSKKEWTFKLWTMAGVLTASAFSFVIWAANE